MSIIFGIRKTAGASVSKHELLRLAQATSRFAADGLTVSVNGEVGMALQPHYTHERSKLETSPRADAFGNLVVIDGRLDNHHALSQELQLDDISTPDSRIVLAAYLRWGKACFSHFIGDWAVALWSASDQSLYLARDHAGTRTLYFENKNGTLLWSTYLDSFFVEPRSIELEKDYVACYLAAQPLRELTPYKGIRAVRPAHYVCAQAAILYHEPHWHWMNKRVTRYNSDRDYEEHFLSLFKQAVERRSGSGAPILAQLSGGMDSSSIVCMSDHIRKMGSRPMDLLDTISLYDDAEPNWNEEPYFSAVETARGKIGIHVPISTMNRSFDALPSSAGFPLLPGMDRFAIERETAIYAATQGKGYRAILSGIGGDEFLGGVPTPMPELADYLVRGKIWRLADRASRWCLIDRSPLLHMLFGATGYALGVYREPRLDLSSIPPWIPTSLRKTCKSARIENFHLGVDITLLPSTISNGLAWWSVMETLPHLFPGSLTRLEYRYPFLDRDLVDYLFSIPREQLVRPGRRRYLMRRALRGIVPEKILERRRKAYLVRGPLVALQHAQSTIKSLLCSSRIGDQGFISVPELLASFDQIISGQDLRWSHGLMRAIAFELWLRGCDQIHTFSETMFPVQLRPGSGG